eukprot:4714710-Alexandrium_andersonii.AAC.1
MCVCPDCTLGACDGLWWRFAPPHRSHAAPGASAAHCQQAQLLPRGKLALGSPTLAAETCRG